MYTRISLLCKALKDVRVYKSPTDMKPSIKIVSQNTTFEVDQLYRTNKLELYHICRPIKETDDIPLGYWIPSSYVESMPIGVTEAEEDKSSKEKPFNGCIYIRNENAILYPTEKDLNPIYNGLKEGNILKVDKVATVENGDKVETRYHVSKVTNADESVKDYWVLGDFIIKSPTQGSPVMTITNPTVTPTQLDPSTLTDAELKNLIKLCDNYIDKLNKANSAIVTFGSYINGEFNLQCFPNNTSKPKPSNTGASYITSRNNAFDTAYNAGKDLYDLLNKSGDTETFARTYMINADSIDTVKNDLYTLVIPDNTASAIRHYGTPPGNYRNTVLSYNINNSWNWWDFSGQGTDSASKLYPKVAEFSTKANGIMTVLRSSKKIFEYTQEHTDRSADSPYKDDIDNATSSRDKTDTLIECIQAAQHRIDIEYRYTMYAMHNDQPVSELTDDDIDNRTQRFKDHVSNRNEVIAKAANGLNELVSQINSAGGYQKYATKYGVSDLSVKDIIDYAPAFTTGSWSIVGRYANAGDNILYGNNITDWWNIILDTGRGCSNTCTKLIKALNSISSALNNQVIDYTKKDSDWHEEEDSKNLVKTPTKQEEQVNLDSCATDLYTVTSNAINKLESLKQMLQYEQSASNLASSTCQSTNNEALSCDLAIQDLYTAINSALTEYGDSIYDKWSSDLIGSCKTACNYYMMGGDAGGLGPMYKNIGEGLYSMSSAVSNPTQYYNAGYKNAGLYNHTSKFSQSKNDNAIKLINQTLTALYAMRSATAQTMTSEQLAQAQNSVKSSSADMFGPGASSNPTTWSSSPASELQDYTSVDDMYGMYGYNSGFQSGTSIMGTPIGKMIFVHGMPFQYTAITDRRINSAGQYNNYGELVENTNPQKSNYDQDYYGRIFAKEIASNMPICVMLPGVPRFLTSIDEGDMKGAFTPINDVAQAFMSAFGAESGTEEGGIAEELASLSGEYDYYRMEPATTSYFQFVNTLCRMSARLMGISTTFRGKKCTDFDWGDYNQDTSQDFNMLASIAGETMGVSFAFDPTGSVTDSLSNSTGQSMFADMLNSVSSKARELDFLFGAGAGIKLGLGDTSGYESTNMQNEDRGFFGSVLSPISRLSSFLANAARGVQVRFPEIWQDSSSSKDYSIDMKFITPYSTAFCKWRYVLVPFFHIFCLAAPQTPENTALNYGRPFLVKVFSKGYFNVEMGIIESLSWKRFGDGDMISEDGVPTEIDVTVGFRDMYQQLAVSKITDLSSGLLGAHGIAAFFNNTGLTDLIGTLSGVNMNRMDIAGRVNLFFGAIGDVVGGTLSSWMRSMQDRVRDIADKWLYGV